MRLITPKRLKENEEYMWQLADRTIDEFYDRGECEFIPEYALPFTLMVVADLLGVPADDRDEIRAKLAGKDRPMAKFRASSVQDATPRSWRTSRSSSSTSGSRATSKTVAASRATTS